VNLQSNGIVNHDLLMQFEHKKPTLGNFAHQHNIDNNSIRRHIEEQEKDKSITDLRKTGLMVSKPLVVADEQWIRRCSLAEKQMPADLAGVSWMRSRTQ
jgi:DNA-binding transcriptional regulator YhcF (GntR family)